jgi:AraC-like DNA-binding protein
VGTKRFAESLQGPGFVLGRWTCTHTHDRPGDEQSLGAPLINVVLDGLFLRHVGRVTLVADPTVAIVAPAGEVWRSSHAPGCRGDRGVYVVLDPDLGPRCADRLRRLSASDSAAWAVAGSDVGLATALVADVIDGAALPDREPAWITRARRLLAAHLHDPPPLEVLAEQVRASPWHLCRTFRAVTGLTPRQYAERLRLAAAWGRIEDGAVSLADVALELGFSSHSHLSARFRAVLGRSPRGARS